MDPRLRGTTGKQVIQLHDYIKFMSKITIRQAVLADLDNLAPLYDQYRQFYKQASDPAGARAFLLERFKHAESVIFIAHDQHGSLGFVQMYPVFESIAMRRRFIFNDLFVVETGRKRGIGKGLIEACAAYGRSLGAGSLGLSTARDNYTAQGLYRATGWELEEVYLEFNLTL